MQVCGQEFNLSTIAQINNLLHKEGSISRRSLSRKVCEFLGWRGENGRFKEMSCRKSLLRLEKKGFISLPETKKTWAFQQPAKKTSELSEKFSKIEGSLEELGEIELILIGSRHSKISRIWNDLMEEYHYLGKGPLCGAQLRYLIRSSRHGYLGGLSISGAAWRVSARDHWIGWSDLEREKNLRHVVVNSRFLILPHVRVPNLASHVLGRLARTLSVDFKNRYGYEPVLMETFVDQEKFLGTCYRAANWREAGVTKGRGRQDTKKTATVSQKLVFIYPLHSDWRERLCCGTERTSVLLPEPPVNPVDWAQEEFGKAVLGDERLKRRLEELGRSFYAQPGSNLPQACGSRAKAKGAYRFFDNKSVTMEKILKPHVEATARRIAEHAIVLSVQDTTSLNYTAHPLTRDMGPINTKGDKGTGLEVHDTMAFTPEGVPLGLLDVQCWARDPETAGQSARRKERPIEEKESFKWIRSYRATAEIQKLCPKTMLVSVGDRESDVHDLFAEAGQNPDGPKLLVRSERSRNRMTKEGNLWEVMEIKEVVGHQELQVPRQGNRKARTALLEVRWSEVMLKTPKTSPHLPSVRAWAVYAREIDFEEPIEWMLLTTVPVTSFEEACERLSWYARRWGIEIYHKTLKSGCLIEDRQLGKASRLESCLAIDMVVAWRIYYLTRQGRETPNVPCTVFFEESEWKALLCFITENPVPPKNPPTLRETVRMVATLGGFLGRKGDGEPGTQTTWRGLQRLDDITATWSVFMRQPATEAQTVYAQVDYG